MTRWRMPIVSIRALLALVLVVGVALAAWLLPYRYHQYRRQFDDANRLVALKTFITFYGGQPTVETRPCWQARLIGDERTGPVTTLRFYDSVVGAEIARVAEFRDLESLQLDDTIDPKGDGLAPLAGLPWLRSLQIVGKGWRDSDLALLKGFRRLESLSLNGGAFTDAGLDHLGELTGLRELILACREDRPEPGLAFLGRMKGLRSLSLEAGLATEAILDVIRTLANLEQLALVNVPITDAGLSRLVGLDRLEILDIESAKLEGRGLACLARLPRLRELCLWSDDGLKNEELGQLRRATQLRSLVLLGNDQLTDGCLGTLKAMTHLEMLKIAARKGGAWSDATVGQLKKALPGTRVEVSYSRSDGTQGSLSSDVPWTR